MSNFWPSCNFLILQIFLGLNTGSRRLANIVNFASVGLQIVKWYVTKNCHTNFFVLLKSFIPKHILQCISFHENGKRHKENVQKHISQLSKKSAKEFKQKEKIDDEMKKMEAAAMAAYLKDVKNNGDLTSKVSFLVYWPERREIP